MEHESKTFRTICHCPINGTFFMDTIHILIKIFCGWDWWGMSSIELYNFLPFLLDFTFIDKKYLFFNKLYVEFLSFFLLNYHHSIASDISSSWPTLKRMTRFHFPFVYIHILYWKPPCLYWSDLMLWVQRYDLFSICKSSCIYRKWKSFTKFKRAE